MIKSPIQFVFVCVCRNTQNKLRVFVGFVDFKLKFCCEFRSWMFFNHSKWITSCFDGLNIPSYLAYSTFLVITNRDFYGLHIRRWVKTAMYYTWIFPVEYSTRETLTITSTIYNYISFSWWLYLMSPTRGPY